MAGEFAELDKTIRYQKENLSKFRIKIKGSPFLFALPSKSVAQCNCVGIGLNLLRLLPIHTFGKRIAYSSGNSKRYFSPLQEQLVHSNASTNTSKAWFLKNSSIKMKIQMKHSNLILHYLYHAL